MTATRVRRTVRWVMIALSAILLVLVISAIVAETTGIFEPQGFGDAYELERSDKVKVKDLSEVLEDQR